MPGTFEQESGPWLGVRERIEDFTDADPRYAQALLNLYPVDRAGGEPSRVANLPGWVEWGAGNTAGNVKVQGVGWFERSTDGKMAVVAIMGGELWEKRNLPTATTVKSVTAANFVTAGVTLSSTAEVFMCQVVDKLVISDGVNAPFMWDGNSGAASVTPLPACPVLYGQPVLFEGRLFGIAAADPVKIVWSEPADPTTGYDTGALNNFWRLVQTSTARLYALAARNEGLYYARDTGIGFLPGPVGPEWSTTTTEDGVSTTLGTRSPRGFLFWRDKLWFVDPRGYPYVYEPGATEPQPIWRDFSESLQIIQDGYLERIVITPDERLDICWFSIVIQRNPFRGVGLQGAADTAQWHLGYDPGTRQGLCALYDFTIYCSARVKSLDVSGSPWTIAHADGGAGHATGVATIFIHHQKNDGVAATGQTKLQRYHAVANTILPLDTPVLLRCVPAFARPNRFSAYEKTFSLVDLLFTRGPIRDATTADWTVYVSTYTPAGAAHASQLITLQDTDWLSSGKNDHKVELGIDATGRHIYFDIVVDQVREFGLSMLTTAGFVTAREPGSW